MLHKQVSGEEQVPFIAVQVVLPDGDMPTACAMVIFSRCFGGAIGLSIAQNIFTGALLPKLGDIPGVNASVIAHEGISGLKAAVPVMALQLVREAFGYAINRTFVMPIAVAAIALLLSFGMQWRRIAEELIPQGEVANQGSSPGTPMQDLK